MSTISPMYQWPTLVAGTPAGGGISCIQSGNAGMAAGAALGIALSWVSVVMVLWVVKAQARATFFRGSPCDARLSKSGLSPRRSCSSRPACSSLRTLTVLWVPSKSGAEERASANIGLGMTLMPWSSLRSVVMYAAYWVRSVSGTSGTMASVSGFTPPSGEGDHVDRRAVHAGVGLEVVGGWRALARPGYLDQVDRPGRGQGVARAREPALEQRPGVGAELGDDHPGGGEAVERVQAGDQVRRAAATLAGMETFPVV